MPKPRSRLRLILLIASPIVAGALLVAGCAGMCRPVWYQPISIDTARLQSDRDHIVQLGGDISDRLNRDESIEFVLDEARLNRLLVGRDELWPVAGLERRFGDARSVDIGAIGAAEIADDDVFAEQLDFAVAA